MLEEENAFYDAHKEEFHEKYLNKWLVITGESLWGVYDNTTEAVEAALESLEPGKIMIHKPANDGRVVYVGPRARIKYPDDIKRPKLRPEMSYSEGNGLLEIPYPY